FGCDLCQVVCPFNGSTADLAPVPLGLRARPTHARPSLAPLLALGSKAYQRYVRGTALRRVRRRQFLRNVCVALGRVGGPGEIPALAEALAPREPLVRGPAAWALGRLGAARILERAVARELDPYVMDELRFALQLASTAPS